MKVMVIVKATKESEAGRLPSQQLIGDMMKFNEELVKAGILLAGDGLQPSSQGKRVWFDGKKRTVTDGPFAETKELIAGFWLWRVKSMEEAVQWVKRCPNPMEEPSEIEIRRVFELEDFGPAATPEILEKEQRMRAEVERYQLDPPRFEEGKELLIAGFNETYTFETRMKIPAQWARFAPHICQIPGQVGRFSYGVCWNYKPGCGFDYLSGVEVRDSSALKGDYTHLRIPTQRYAVFTHRKHVSAIVDTFDAIWKKWLPNSGHTPADAPSFERYGDEFDPQTGNGSFEIWVPLKA